MKSISLQTNPFFGATCASPLANAPSNQETILTPPALGLQEWLSNLRRRIDGAEKLSRETLLEQAAKSEDASDAAKVAALDEKAQATLTLGLLGAATRLGSFASPILSKAAFGSASAETWNESVRRSFDATEKGISTVDHSNEVRSDRELARIEQQSKSARRVQERLQSELTALKESGNKMAQLENEIGQSRLRLADTILLRSV